MNSGAHDSEKAGLVWSAIEKQRIAMTTDGEDPALVAVDPEEANIWDSTSSGLLYAGKVIAAAIQHQQTVPLARLD